MGSREKAPNAAVQYAHDICWVFLYKQVEDAFRIGHSFRLHEKLLPKLRRP